MRCTCVNDNAQFYDQQIRLSRVVVFIHLYIKNILKIVRIHSKRVINENKMENIKNKQSSKKDLITKVC